MVRIEVEARIYVLLSQILSILMLSILEIKDKISLYHISSQALYPACFRPVRRLRAALTHEICLNL